MESTEQGIILTRSTDSQVLYTAVGWIAGSFLPGKKSTLGESSLHSMAFQSKLNLIGA